MSSTRPSWADMGPRTPPRRIPLLGPQAERSSEWVNRDGEVQGPPKREVCTKYLDFVWPESYSFVLKLYSRHSWSLGTSASKNPETRL